MKFKCISKYDTLCDKVDVTICMKSIKFPSESNGYLFKLCKQDIELLQEYGRLYQKRDIIILFKEKSLVFANLKDEKQLAPSDASHLIQGEDGAIYQSGFRELCEIMSVQQRESDRITIKGIIDLQFLKFVGKTIGNEDFILISFERSCYFKQDPFLKSQFTMKKNGIKFYESIVVFNYELDKNQEFKAADHFQMNKNNNKEENKQIVNYFRIRKRIEQAINLLSPIQTSIRVETCLTLTTRKFQTK